MAETYGLQEWHMPRLTPRAIRRLLEHAKEKEKAARRANR